MARTISEIKEQITTEFMSNKTAAEKYGFTAGDNFADTFSKASIESILFYVFAFCAWTVEVLFDSYSTEVTARIEEIMPHRCKWYRDKALKFMKNKTLITDTDNYDIEGMNDGDIEAAHVVKHAVAIESDDASILTIKVAGEANGKRVKLDDATLSQFSTYINEIKDAGVRISIVNSDADTFNCEVDIYYNPIILPENVKDSCLAAIKNYIENLPFNGEYTNMALVDMLQTVTGVKVVEFKGATYSAADVSLESAIDARIVPYAGYFKVGNVVLRMKAYE